MDRREALQAMAMLAGIPAAVVRGGRLSSTPSALRVLTESQNATVVALAERIMPATDTPGATAARVNEFMDVLLADWYTDTERADFLSGLAEVETRARAAIGRPFAAGTPADQDRVVAALDAEAYQVPPAERSPVQRFYVRFKATTLYGYYNSEVGMKQELRYEIIPNRYDPCVTTAAG